ncbi:MAG TPA: ABC transporter substrate-binding protein [Candidatus Corynebacterium avicola]|uniref:ABC transporter substrate-binding protein n=1 Tax=Candidatus Corynebacterium avicola TaxID=2838527 RepID=A0A9D1RN09_9CORY|nr:ABC transporter substrate-binding protein [Candidatus Corynebacterium avicola]
MTFLTPKSHTRRRRAAHAVTAVVAATALLLSGCSSEDADSSSTSSDSGTRSFTADNGTFDIPEEPERIVAIGRAVPSLLTTDAPLVGIAEYEGMVGLNEEQEQTYEDLPKVGTGADMDYEKIASLEPDIIISGVPLRNFEKVDEESLQSIAPTLSLGPLTPSEWKEFGQQQTDAANVSGAFDDQKAEYEARAEELHEKYRDKIDGMNFGAVAQPDEGRSGFGRHYSGSWYTNIPEDAGLTFPGEGADTEDNGATFSEALSFEKISDMEGMDAILYPVEEDGKPTPELQELLDQTAFQELPAVKAGRVLPVFGTTAETYAGGLVALDSLEDALENLPD